MQTQSSKRRKKNKLITQPQMLDKLTQRDADFFESSYKRQHPKDHIQTMTNYVYDKADDPKPQPKKTNTDHLSAQDLKDLNRIKNAIIAKEKTFIIGADNLLNLKTTELKTVRISRDNVIKRERELYDNH